ncbi:hypothetical protein PFISCL1PPCAC_14670 [Pristionchus fissidentatus]|uniref:SXP/RAL-2 family protein Ani s 5-like cation-binding domain-containing protein n=1 Tax=Pristionchus fissidentatus TaxID=1538716 RepID=A0AAV5VVB7_9BILA|nr:hypothetical protein PFISCL1PPCAC_14670 [Pristionchus fissidentatus]
MKFFLFLTLLSICATVSNGVGTTPDTKTINAKLPGAGQNPAEIQSDINRIQGEIQNLNSKVVELLAALNETNAAPFMQMDKLRNDIGDQQTKLFNLNKTITDLSGQVNTNNDAIKMLTDNVNCFVNSGCGPESF